MPTVWKAEILQLWPHRFAVRRFPDLQVFTHPENLPGTPDASVEAAPLPVLQALTMTGLAVAPCANRRQPRVPHSTRDRSSPSPQHQSWKSARKSGNGDDPGCASGLGQGGDSRQPTVTLIVGTHLSLGCKSIGLFHQGL